MRMLVKGDLMKGASLGWFYCLPLLFRCRISSGLKIFGITTGIIAKIERA